jgi:hypothetical protein
MRGSLESVAFWQHRGWHGVDDGVDRFASVSVDEVYEEENNIPALTTRGRSSPLRWRVRWHSAGEALRVRLSADGHGGGSSSDRGSEDRGELHISYFAGQGLAEGSREDTRMYQGAGM